MSRPCTDIINMGMFRLRQLTKEQEGGWGMPISIYMIRMQCSTPCISPCSVLSPADNHASNVATGYFAPLDCPDGYPDGYSWTMLFRSWHSIIVKKVIWAAEKLASQRSIDQYIITGLTEALRNEKKRRQRGKRLNLLGENDSGPQFFSPGRIQAAREYQIQKSANETLRQQEIANIKALAATKRAQKEADRIQRSIATARRREIAAEAKIQKAINKQAQQELKKAAASQSDTRRQFKSLKKAPKPIGRPRDILSTGLATIQKKEVVLATSRGRQVHRPQRFDN